MTSQLQNSDLCRVTKLEMNIVIQFLLAEDDMLENMYFRVMAICGDVLT